jgi:hypothetical protein
LQIFEWGVLPITGSEDDRDHANIPALVPLKGMLHLLLITIVRVKKIGAAEQEDY